MMNAIRKWEYEIGITCNEITNKKSEKNMMGLKCLNAKKKGKNVKREKNRK